jgi:hypothetical protein
MVELLTNDKDHFHRSVSTLLSQSPVSYPLSILGITLPFAD